MPVGIFWSFQHPSAASVRRPFHIQKLTQIPFDFWTARSVSCSSPSSCLRGRSSCPTRQPNTLVTRRPAPPADPGGRTGKGEEKALNLLSRCGFCCGLSLLSPKAVYQIPLCAATAAVTSSCDHRSANSSFWCAPPSLPLSLSSSDGKMGINQNEIKPQKCGAASLFSASRAIFD